MSRDADELARIRRLLLWTLAIGMAGTGTELLLLGHFEGRLQLIPLALLGLSTLVVLWHAVRPTRTSVRAVQIAMTASVAAGVLGIGLHYRGNREFELEMYPTMSGGELLGKVVTGATPVLAPASLSLLGIIGLLHAHRHPALSRNVVGQEERS